MNKTTHPNKETTLKKLQLTEMGIFHTPQSVDEIVEYIDTLPTHQRANAWVVYGLLNNLICDRLRQGAVVIAGGES